ncbi:MAG: dockerin type I domain-containing protein [Eubacteriales bacterium]
MYIYMRGKNIKKFLSVAVAIAFVFSFSSFRPAALSPENDLELAYSLITEAVENLSDTVDILQAKLVYDYGAEDSPMLTRVLDEIRNDRPDFFYLDFSFGFKAVYQGSAYYVQELYLYYTLPDLEIAEAINFVNGEIDDIINAIPRLWELDRISQALMVHDYLALHFNYDYSLENGDVYSMLTDKTGVCQAFTGLYALLMERLEIEVSWASSEDMNHIWNLIKIGGEWYHVDNTWDDSDFTGKVYHRYFLKSDAAFLTPPTGGDNHYNWVSKYTCDDDSYDAYYWNTINSPIICSPGEFYYIKQAEEFNGGLLVRNTGGEETTAAEIRDYWRTYDKTGFYPGVFSGLAAYGKYYYFNDSSSIYRYDSENGAVTKIFGSDSLDGNIYGIAAEFSDFGCAVSYEVAKSPASAGSVFVVTDSPDCPFGHSFGEWETLTDPTEHSPGLRQKVCGVCGETIEDSIPILSETNGYEYFVESEPTYTKDGVASWSSDEYGVFYTFIPKLTLPVTELAQALDSSLIFEDGFVRGFDVGAKISEYLNDGFTVVVYNGIKIATQDILATGYVITLFDGLGNEVDSAIVVIKGDANGDGKIDAKDYISIKLAILGITPLGGAQTRAADVNGSGNVEQFDYISVRLSLLGLRVINQK